MGAPEANPGWRARVPPPDGCAVTKPKGDGPHHRGMKTNDRMRAEARSRASRRLRTMTIGTAILGIAATGALGWAAAGTPVGGITAPASTATVTTNTSNGGTGGSTANAPVVTGVTGGAHVSTGGT
jgi:anti-sigma factor RsiW